VLPGVYVLEKARRVHPLIDLAIFGVRSIIQTDAMMACVYAGNIAMLFLLILYSQGVEH
jgi:hypothetical protein